MWRRFWKYVPTGLPDDICWPWQSSLDAHGYGQLSDKPNRTVLKAHRLSYEAHYGSLPDDVWICHRCDNPECVNPRHLFAGTPADNHADMVSKGRHSYPPRMLGDNHPQRLLSESDVIEIRKSGKDRKELASIYGVSVSTITAVLVRQNWKHL